MTIYTKYGDSGFTRMVGGQRVKKSHLRVAAYGTTDELCSQVGFAIALLEEHELRQELLMIQQLIFDCSSDLAVPDESRPYKVTQEAAELLEERIDSYWEQCPPLEQFILPGGTLFAAALHLARCSARKAERKTVSLMDNEEKVNPFVLSTLNRLSDYFFALARWHTAAAGAEEITYHKSPAVFSKRRRHVSGNDESEK